MTLFAYIRDAVVVHISTSSGEPLSNATVVPVPEGSVVEVGYGYDGATFTSPPPVVLTPPKVGPIHFQMLFTMEEGEKADELQATDKTLARFWKLVNDPRTDVIDLSLQSVQNAVEYTLTVVKMAGVTVDVPVRKAEILTGVLK